MVMSIGVVNFKKSKYDVYIGRPTKWGNPFTHRQNGKTLAKYIVSSREDAVEAYRSWIMTGEGRHLLNDLHELQNKTLGCWCAPKACHGDVLIELANSGHPHDKPNIDLFRVIIAGSRSFDNYNLLKTKCDYFLSGKERVEIVSGTAKGADLLGERYASEKGINIMRFPANWEEYGNRAGYLRNKSMAEYADALIAFWDGTSKGTNHMIKLAQDAKLKIKVVRVQADVVHNEVKYKGL